MIKYRGWQQVLESKGEAPKALERCKIALDIYVGRLGSVGLMSV